MNWLNLGFELVRLLLTVILSLVSGVFVFRRYMAPEIMAALTEARKTASNLAKLSGVKSQEFTASRNLEKTIAKDVITKQMPELEALKLILSPSTWEKVEDAIEDNPEAILQLYQKYAPLLQVGTNRQDEYDL